MSNFAPKAAYLDDDPFADDPVDPIDMNSDPFADQSREAQEVAAKRPVPTRKKFGRGVMSPLAKLFRGRSGKQEVAVATAELDDPFSGDISAPIDTGSDAFSDTGMDSGEFADPQSIDNNGDRGDVNQTAMYQELANGAELELHAVLRGADTSGLTEDERAAFKSALSRGENSEAAHIVLGSGPNVPVQDALNTVNRYTDGYVRSNARAA